MVNNKKKFWTISEIDATGVRGPHEIELKNISNAKYHHFINIDREKLLKIVKEDLGAKLETLSSQEDWTITIEMFPQVKIHIICLYQNKKPDRCGWCVLFKVGLPQVK